MKEHNGIKNKKKIKANNMKITKWKFSCTGNKFSQ